MREEGPISLEDLLKDGTNYGWNEMEARMREVAEIHRPDTRSMRHPACEECGGYYPCRTRRALEGMDSK